jgi:hypothetical protein
VLHLVAVLVGVQGLGVGIEHRVRGVDLDLECRVRSLDVDPERRLRGLGVDRNPALVLDIRAPSHLQAMKPLLASPPVVLDRPAQRDPSRAVTEARLIALLGRDAPPVQEARDAWADVPDAELDSWLSMLARYEQACGCKSGATSAMLVLALWPAFGPRRRSVSNLRDAGAALAAWGGATVTGAVAGKVGGLAVSAAARKRLLRRIPGAGASRAPDH